MFKHWFHSVYLLGEKIDKKSGRIKMKKSDCVIQLEK